MRYWMVMCMRGHCGTGHGREIRFAIAAKDLLSACDIARKMPSVKHTRGVLYGKEITEIEYIEYRQVSAYDRDESRQERARRRR